MTNNTDTQACTLTCWGIAALAGIAIMALLMVVGGWAFVPSVFIGLIAALILGFVLTWSICSAGTAKDDLEAVRSGAKGAEAAKAEATANLSATSSTAAAATAGAAGAGAAAAAVSAASAESAAQTSASDASAESAAQTSASDASAESAAQTSASDASAESAGATAGSDSAGSADSASSTPSGLMAADAGGSAVKPSQKLAGEEELASRKGEWKYEAPQAKTTKAKKAPAKKKAVEKAPAAADASTAAAPAEASQTVAESQPETLTGPRGTADDLKKISGVGPKLEGVLNDLGFWHFWQIAQWGPQEVAWVDTRLKFKGRIERDNWIDQAKTLAEGQGA